MKLPNGYGSVYKMPGTRRKPWIARITVGWQKNPETGRSKQIYAIVGYFEKRTEALNALANYNEDPYDIKRDTITFAEVYEKWSEQHFQTIVKSAVRTWISAYNYCSGLYDMRMKDIRVMHLEETIKNADVGSATKGRIKSLFNMIYKYAMKHEIVDKDYAALCDSVKKDRPQIIRIPFSQDEIKLLQDNIVFPFVDMILIGIYSGWRPQELAILKIDDIDFENNTFKGGLKTDAGKNRVVPIHPLILDIVKSCYDKALEMNSDFLFNDENGQQGTKMTYDKYRARFIKVMTKLKLEHKPHDTRHTFITKGKEAGMDEYVLKLIVGHAIEDITEKVYTHRTLEQLQKEIGKIKE